MRRKNAKCMIAFKNSSLTKYQMHDWEWNTAHSTCSSPIKCMSQIWISWLEQKWYNVWSHTQYHLNWIWNAWSYKKIHTEWPFLPVEKFHSNVELIMAKENTSYAIIPPKCHHQMCNAWWWKEMCSVKWFPPKKGTDKMECAVHDIYLA